MTDDETPFDVQRRDYQWHVGYDREDEYEKNPDWAVDTRSSVTEEGELVLYDEYDAEHIWIKSDTVYDLTNCL